MVGRAEKTDSRDIGRFARDVAHAEGTSRYREAWHEFEPAVEKYRRRLEGQSRRHTLPPANLGQTL